MPVWRFKFWIFVKKSQKLGHSTATFTIKSTTPTCGGAYWMPLAGVIISSTHTKPFVNILVNSASALHLRWNQQKMLEVQHLVMVRFQKIKDVTWRKTRQKGNFHIICPLQLALLQTKHKNFEISNSKFTYIYIYILLDSINGTLCGLTIYFLLSKGSSKKILRQILFHRNLTGLPPPPMPPSRYFLAFMIRNY